MQAEKNNIIVEAILAGNEEAFNAFYRAEFNNILFFVDQYLHDRAVSQDIAQETFLSLWDGRGQVDPQRNLRAYVFTIARNKALNQLRADMVRKRNPDIAREKAVQFQALGHPSVEEQVEALQLEELIRKMYALLPETVRESFVLSREMGLSYQEIAEKKGISIKVVEYQIALALRLFRKKFKGYPLPVVLMILLKLSAYFSGGNGS